MGPRTILAIHDFLHSHKVGQIMKFSIGNTPYQIEIMKAEGGLKYMNYQNITFMEQNKKKDSLYAHMARQGKKITWGIQKGTWIKVVDNSVYYEGKVYKK